METNFSEMELEDLENTDLICTYCNRKIDILNENLQFSFDYHSQSPFHIRAYRLSQKNNTVQSDAQEQNQHKIDLIFKNILKKFKNDKTYLTVLNDNIFCNLCRFEITHKDSLNFKLVEEHLGGKIHATYLNVIGSKPNVIYGENLPDSELLYEMLSDGDVFSNLPQKLSVNRYYIFMNQDGRYFCQICEILIEVNNDSVLKHIESKVHLTTVNQKYDNCSVIIENSIKIKHLEDYGRLENTECASINKIAEQQDATLSPNLNILTHKPEMGSLVKSTPEVPNAHNISVDCLDSKVDSFSLTYTTEKYKLNSEISSGYECLKKLLHPYLPKEIEENHMFIVKITDDEFSCVLCKAKLFITKNVDNTIHMLCQHFNGKKHVQNIELKNPIKLKDISDPVKPKETLSSLVSSVETKCVSNNLSLQSDNNIKPNIASTLEVKEPSTNICFLEADDNKSDGQGDSQFAPEVSANSSSIPVMADYDPLKSLIHQNLLKEIEKNQDGNEARSCNTPKPAISLVKSKAEQVLASKESPKPTAHSISVYYLNFLKFISIYFFFMILIAYIFKKLQHILEKIIEELF